MTKDLVLHCELMLVYKNPYLFFLCHYYLVQAQCMALILLLHDQHSSIGPSLFAVGCDKVETLFYLYVQYLTIEENANLFYKY